MNKVVFLRIGRMEFYDGPQLGDEGPVDGGKYNEENIGLEVCNFWADGTDILWGFSEPPSKKTGKRKLRKIDKDYDPENSTIYENKRKCVEGVLVIFIHKLKLGGQVIAGWYHDAIVLEKEISRIYKGKEYTYNIEASADAGKTVLLPIEKRRYRIKGVRGVGGGKGGFGQNNTRYTLYKNGRPERQKWMRDAINWVKKYQGPNLMDENYRKKYIQRIKKRYQQEQDLADMENNRIRSSGQGRIMNYATRQKVEKFAMERAAVFYDHYYDYIEDTSQFKPYDLECWKRKKTKDKYGNILPDKLRVEVKGTTSKGRSVDLTKNEVKNAENNDSALFILHSIEMEDDEPVKGSGEGNILCPWNPRNEEQGKLDVTYYSYRPNDNSGS